MTHAVKVKQISCLESVEEKIRKAGKGSSLPLLVACNPEGSTGCGTCCSASARLALVEGSGGEEKLCVGLGCVTLPRMVPRL